jgi:hypothetical protein
MLERTGMKKTMIGFAAVATFTLAIQGNALAGTIDLLTAGASGTANGAIFTQVDPQSTGTGVLDPFLRIQANGTESGYNTSVGTPLDDKGGKWTHDIALGTIGIVTYNAVNYYKFLLDVNQLSSSPLLSLNTFQIYERTGPLTTANTLADLTGNATLKFDMDAGVGGDTTVNIDYRLNPGSGAGDMTVLVPVSALGIDPTLTQNLYLYTAFGDPNASNSGFEEWAAELGIGFYPPQDVPDASTTLSLLGMALLGIEGLRRKFRV